MKTSHYNCAEFFFMLGEKHEYIKFSMSEFNPELYDVITNYINKKYDKVVGSATLPSWCPLPENEQQQ